jgi:hypothetical protein
MEEMDHDEVRYYDEQLRLSGRANEFIHSEAYAWFNENVLVPIEKTALNDWANTNPDDKTMIIVNQQTKLVVDRIRQRLLELSEIRNYIKTQIVESGE